MLLEAGHAHPHQAERAWPVAERPIEERTGELADPLARRRFPPGSEVERVRIEKSGYRTFVVTVRATWLRPRRYSASLADIRRSSSWSRSGSPISRSNVSSCEIEIRSTDMVERREDRSRGHGRAARVRPSPAARRRRSSSVSAAISPIVLMPSATRRSSARGPTPGRSRIGNGARNAASRPGRTAVSPAGLRRSEATFATTFDVATPSEQVSLVRARTTACTASASARASSNAGATSPRSR